MMPNFLMAWQGGILRLVIGGHLVDHKELLIASLTREANRWRDHCSQCENSPEGSLRARI